MTKGVEDNAKKIIIDRADEIMSHLDNGSVGDLKTHGEAIKLIMEILKVLFVENFRTVDDCEDLRKECKDQCKVDTKGQHYKFSLGPLTAQGAWSNFGIATLFFLYLVGKGKGFW